MGSMFSDEDFVLDCRTCVAVNTTACSDCVVQHLIANDAGPIEFVPTPIITATERAVRLFAKAGLLDDEPNFVAYAEFESGVVPQLA